MKNKKILYDKIIEVIDEKRNGGSTRYRSWEYCYEYFLRDRQQIDIKDACLNLAFYLASWGMYRGSSFLLQQDYIIHDLAVNKILSQKKYFQNINFSEIDDVTRNNFI